MEFPPEPSKTTWIDLTPYLYLYVVRAYKIFRFIVTVTKDAKIAPGGRSGRGVPHRASATALWGWKYNKDKCDSSDILVIAEFNFIILKVKNLVITI